MTTLIETNPRTQLEEWARRCLVGGVNSPVRSFSSVEVAPIYARSAQGAVLVDEFGKSYLDLISAWGANVLGHAHPKIVSAAVSAVQTGSCFGLTCENEIRLAELLIQRVPDVLERIRFANSGTEAVMTAVKLARHATGRRTILKFEGNYHGHATVVMSEKDSTESMGQSTALVELPYNDLQAFTKVMNQVGESIAAVIVEPVCGNMGLVPPTDGFLKGLRDVTKKHAALLIFDEVMTGFRIARGGAVERFGVRPDLVVYGKVIGGGFPIGAVGGPAVIMDLLAPSGPVYHAGTFAGNPVTMAAGMATMQLLDQNVYEQLESRGAQLERELIKAAELAGIPVVVNRIGSMLSVFFSDIPVIDSNTANASDLAQFTRFFNVMLNKGVLLPPSPLEAWFLNAAHTESNITQIAHAAECAFSTLAHCQ